MKEENPYGKLQSDRGDEPKGWRGQEHLCPRQERQGRRRIPLADEGGVGAAALLDALRDWFAEEFTAFLIEGEEAVGTVDHFHGGVVAVLFHGAACARNGDVFAEIF